MPTSNSEKRTKISEIALAKILGEHERFVTGRGGTRAMLKGADLDGAVLANRRLDDADLTGVSMVGANLYGSSLSRASLYCADLRRANLRNAKLVRADLRGASFCGADLSYAVLDGTDLRSAKMMVHDGIEVSVVDRSPDGDALSGVDFSHCSLRHASFGNARLEAANFTGAVLYGTSFRGAVLTDAKFVGAVIMGVNIAELKLPPEAFVDCVFDVTQEAAAKAATLKAMIEGHHQWVSSDGRDGRGAVLDGEDLRPVLDQFAGRSLIGLSARAAIGIGVDFSGCQLQGAKFDGADLRGANFTGADLSGASFHAAKLMHARFDKAKLAKLPLQNGDMLAANLSGAEVRLEQLSSAVLEGPLESLGLDPAAQPDYRAA